MKLSRFEAAMRLVLEFNEAFNRQDLAGMMKLVGEDCIIETSTPPPEGIRYTGKEAITRYYQDFFHQSPQSRIEIEEIFGFGERCVMRWKCHWVSAQGEQHYVRGVDIFRVRDGSIRERLSYVKG